MAVDTQQIMDGAEKLGQLVAQHPAVARYKEAQKAIANDPDATKLLTDFNRHLETLMQLEQSGMQVTDAQRSQLENLQRSLSSHLRVKALNAAEVEFVDLLRRISQTIRRQVAEPVEKEKARPAGPHLAV